MDNNKKHATTDNKNDSNIINGRDEYIRLTDHAYKQIDWVRKTWLWTSGFIAMIIAVGGIIFFNNMSEFKRETRDDLLRFKESLSREVKAKVDKEFEDKNIHSLVVSTAQERVDAIAKPIIQSNIEVIVTTEIAPLKLEITSLYGNYLETKTVVSNLLFTVQNRKKEVFTVADTNRLIVAEKENGGVDVFIRLSTVPMAGSVDVEVPGAQDRPDASTRILGNVYAATYVNGSFDKLKASLITVKYYPSVDQSESGQMMTLTANNEVIVGSVRYGNYKRIASP